MEDEHKDVGTSVTFGDVAPLDTGAVAAACASLGWRVFPIVAGGSTPAVKDWPRVAATDLDTIEEWWGQRYHGYGVGIVTGKGMFQPRSRAIWVLDLDVKNGQDGITALRKIEADEVAHGGEPLPETFTVRTRSGGLHMYWQWPDDGEGIRNSTSMIGPGIDVRGENGYVRAPVKASSVEVNVQPVEAPEWLLTRARWSKRYAKVQHDGGDWKAVHPKSWMSAENLVEHVSLKLARARSGGRNDALNRAAFTLALWGVNLGVTGGEALASLRWACQRNGLWEDDGPDGCTATFNSGWEAGVAAADAVRGDDVDNTE